MTEPFRVGLTRDALRSDGTLALDDLGLRVLDETSGLEWELLPEHGSTLLAEHVAGFDALLQLAPTLTPAAVSAAAKRLAIVARLGVGYDNVPLEACTEAGVVATITPDAVRRPVATSALTLVLALGHKLLLKDRLTREGRWAEKLQYMGTGLVGRTLGIIGLGNIGQELARLVGPLDLRLLAADPAVDPAVAARLGVALVDHDTLFRESDFVCVLCQLDERTHHLVDARRLALMRPTAYLVNLARGPIVDQAALLAALQAGQIAGAGLDVFEQEPVDPADPLLALENVIVTPHALCWTDQCFAGLGRSACESVLAVMAGRVPQHVVNGEVVQSARFQEKLARYAEVAR